MHVFSSGVPSLMKYVHGKLKLSVKLIVLMSEFLSERSTLNCLVSSGDYFPRFSCNFILNIAVVCILMLIGLTVTSNMVLSLPIRPIDLNILDMIYDSLFFSIIKILNLIIITFPSKKDRSII